MRIVLLEEAQRELETRDTWWRENRDETDLFMLEFEEALRHLEAAPESGQLYDSRGGRVIRRWLNARGQRLVPARSEPPNALTMSIVPTIASLNASSSSAGTHSSSWYGAPTTCFGYFATTSERTAN